MIALRVKCLEKAEHLTSQRTRQRADGGDPSRTATPAQIRELREEADEAERTIRLIDGRLGELRVERGPLVLAQAVANRETADTAAIAAVERLATLVDRCRAQLLPVMDAANKANADARVAEAAEERAGGQPPIPPRRELQGWDRHPGLIDVMRAVRAFGQAQPDRS